MQPSRQHPLTNGRKNVVLAQGCMNTWAEWGLGKGRVRGSNPWVEEHRPFDTFFSSFWKSIGLIRHSDSPWDICPIQRQGHDLPWPNSYGNRTRSLSPTVINTRGPASVAFSHDSPPGKLLIGRPVTPREAWQPHRAWWEPEILQ